MAINTIHTETLGGGSQPQVSITIDYDAVGQDVGLTVIGGNAEVWLIRNSDNAVVGAVTSNQWNEDGQRHIVIGPGASGTDVNNKPLPTVAVTTQPVVDAQKGQTTTYRVLCGLS